MGSSPRVRGKLLGFRDNATRPGLIPARAGKTPPPSASPSRSSAHPRACGENPPGRAPRTPPGGSSPRVRGKPAELPRGHSPVRLIPARAGKTRAGHRGTVRSRAHPRACGENCTPRRGGRAGNGSSPRVRGKQTPYRRRLDAGRLIPARAGKTGPAHAACSPARAHPRACGENAS